ncbi:MAG: hypothetical protein HQM15_00890 [Deltaproteobacteria bacterium]|nr:hypothetical protein [Deltaproteobacteria bacterium]
MRDRKNIYWTLAILAFFLFWVWGETQVSLQKKEDQATAYSSQGRGLNFFYKLSESLSPGRVQLSGRLFNNLEELKSYKSMALLSPKSEFRKDQKEIYKQFVESGGLLLLSFEDEKEFKNMESFLSEMGISLQLKKREDFRNQTLSLLSPQKESDLFSPEETYAFYSQFEMENPFCKDHGFECYVYQQDFEEGGAVWVMAGLPLLSNALIVKNENRLAAFRLLENYSPLILDEYHHFYSDYDFFKLMQQPRFLFPFLGFFLSIFLFLFFSHALQDEEEVFEAQAESGPDAPLTFHGFNENLLYATLAPSSSYPSALNQHLVFLQKKFPRRHAEILGLLKPDNNLKNVPHFLKEGMRLLVFHQNCLTEKGKR